MKQFEDYLVSQQFDPWTMSEEEKIAVEENFIQKLYPGSTTHPGSIINVLTSENPSETIKAKVVTDPSSVCVDVSSECKSPWIVPTEPMPNVTACMANLGKTTAKIDQCADIGGETIYFSPDLIDLGQMLSNEVSTEGKNIKAI